MEQVSPTRNVLNDFGLQALHQITISTHSTRQQSTRSKACLNESCPSRNHPLRRRPPLSQRGGTACSHHHRLLCPQHGTHTNATKQSLKRRILSLRHSHILLMSSQGRALSRCRRAAGATYQSQQQPLRGI